MPRKNTFWIGENGRRAKVMWAEKYTSREIADALGTTRNAVIGYIHRHSGMPKRAHGRPAGGRRSPKPVPAVPLAPGTRVSHSEHYHKTMGGALNRGRIGTVTKFQLNTRWVLWDGKDEATAWFVGFLEPIAAIDR